jgi:predicted PurR-regulated permease PerM
MAFPERHTANILLTVLFFAAVCAAVYGARRIILIFVFAILFAYLIDPRGQVLAAAFLVFQEFRVPAMVDVYLALVILMAVLGYAFAPGLARNTLKLVDEVPVLLDGLSPSSLADTATT